MQGLREGGQAQAHEMWLLKSESRGKFVHVTYAAVQRSQESFKGALNMCAGHPTLTVRD